MTTIIYLPIEPLNERYTEQWFRIFPKEFENAGFDVVVVQGEPLLQDEIKVGSFLDINSTIHYKMTQLQTVSQLFHRQQVPQDSIFFFGDIEFWGLEAIRLMADMNRIRVKMVGFLHAASYTQEDAFAIAAPYQQFTELGWIAALDKVFVGSQYHKDTVIKRRITPLAGANTMIDEALKLSKKIVVTQNPIFMGEYKRQGLAKQNKVLLTNRLDEEKRPLETLQLFGQLKKTFPHWEFVITTGRKSIRTPNNKHITDVIEEMVLDGLVTVKANLTKAEYHAELETAKVMVTHSIEENYGYCIAEAIVYDCVPVVRKGLSHTELVRGRTDLMFTHQSVVNGNGDYVVVTQLMHKLEAEHRYATCPPLDTNGMANIINELIEWRAN